MSKEGNREFIRGNRIKDGTEKVKESRMKTKTDCGGRKRHGLLFNIGSYPTVSRSSTVTFFHLFDAVSGSSVRENF